MNTMFKFLRDAWKMATGIILAPLRQAEKKNIRTYGIKRAHRRNYALQTLSHLHSPRSERSRYMNQWFRTHTPPME